jgi:hypothetical protein
LKKKEIGALVQKRNHSEDDLQGVDRGDVDGVSVREDKDDDNEFAEGLMN